VAFRGGERETLRLLKSIFGLKLSFATIFVIFVLPLLSALIPYLFIYTKSDYPSEFFTNPVSVFVVFFIMLFTGGPVCEEFGWRGYALPRVLKLTTPFNFICLYLVV